jgi:hypothetical protein
VLDWLLDIINWIEEVVNVILFEKIADFIDGYWLITIPIYFEWWDWEESW